MTWAVVLALGLGVVEGQPCGAIDVAALTQGLAVPAGVSLGFSCVDGVSRLEVRREGFEPVVRDVRLEGDEAQQASLLRLLVEETLEVAPTQLAPLPVPAWRSSDVTVGPSVMASSGVAPGASLRLTLHLIGRLALLASLAGGGWAETVALGRLSWQHLDAALGLVWQQPLGPVVVRMGLLGRAGVVLGQGVAGDVDVEARRSVGGFVGPGLHLGVMLALGQQWALSVQVEPGLSVAGAVASAGDVRRGLGRWWCVAGVGVGLRW